MKVVLVTGGAGGIGSAICKKMAENGYSVIITYNSNREKAEKFVETLHCNLSTQQHAIFHAPTTDAEKLNALSDFIKTTYGKLDILVNNAGITTPVPHDDLDGLTDEWIDKIMQTNVRGTFAMIRACRDAMLGVSTNSTNAMHRVPANAMHRVPTNAMHRVPTNAMHRVPATDEPALIINISSVAATTGIGSNVAYCASKAAVDSMTRSLARALAPKIRVVSVSPGWVLGEYAKSVDPAYLKMQEDLTPLSRLATPEDVANTVYAVAEYLTFTTGSVIPVDGGRPLR